jgi:hypothetical protein
MNLIQKILTVIALMLAVAISSCSHDVKTDENKNSGNLSASRGDHNRDSSEQGVEEGEESGTEYALNETYDQVRNGARLILAYNVQSNAFIGTVENTTDKTLKQVRVEVHLSNGIELGPTTPVNIEPRRKRDVKLIATNKDFDRWTAHPEVGSSERGHAERDGEHDQESRSEHNEEHRERDSD